MFEVHYRCMDCANKITRNIPKVYINNWECRDNQRVYCRHCEGLREVVYVKEIDFEDKEDKQMLA